MNLKQVSLFRIIHLASCYQRYKHLALFLSFFALSSWNSIIITFVFSSTGSQAIEILRVQPLLTQRFRAFADFLPLDLKSLYSCTVVGQLRFIWIGNVRFIAKTIPWVSSWMHLDGWSTVFFADIRRSLKWLKISKKNSKNLENPIFPAKIVTTHKTITYNAFYVFDACVNAMKTNHEYTIYLYMYQLKTRIYWHEYKWKCWIKNVVSGSKSSVFFFLLFLILRLSLRSNRISLFT